MHRRIGWVIVGVILAGGGQAFALDSGKAMIHGTTEDSPVTGTAVFKMTEGGNMSVVVDIEHASPGLHGLHIHQFGACDDAGKAAGGHYNPDAVKHGNVMKEGVIGAHAGDFGNIKIGPDGTGHLEVMAPALALGGDRRTIGGRAIILHEKADDFGQPTGNAGGRIACGTIVITGD